MLLNFQMAREKMVGMGAYANTDGVSDVNSSIITAKKAYELMKDELEKANNIGVSNAAGDKAIVTHNVNNQGRVRH